MRITTGDLDGFLENLKNREVFDSTVYYEQTRRPIGQDARRATSWEVYLAVTAIVVLSAGAEALVACGVSCGIDRDSDGGSREGSDAAAARIKRLKGHCEAKGLSVMPGMLSE